MPHAHKDPTAPPALTVEGAADRLAPRYRVAAVEARTGIPASTLRSWERRYGFPRPLRTATGQRLYSDHDVALIRFLARQRAEGLSIGQVTALLRQAGTEADPEQLLERLIRALGAFDEAGAERCFAAAVRLLGLEGAALAAAGRLRPGGAARTGRPTPAAAAAGARPSCGLPRSPPARTGAGAGRGGPRPGRAGGQPHHGGVPGADHRLAPARSAQCPLGARPPWRRCRSWSLAALVGRPGAARGR